VGDSPLAKEISKEAGKKLRKQGGKYLKKLRNAAGLTQRAVAEAITITPY
jgi:DNA-binding XRE family transcriptional regulator